MSLDRYLVVIETLRVKRFLFASPFLRETRGASALLDRLNRAETRALLAKFPGGKEIYFAGGSGRALFSNAGEAEGFASAVRDLYRRETESAQVSAVAVEREPAEAFAAWMARGVGASQKTKTARIEGVPILGGRWLRPCTSCGQEPAVESSSDIQGAHRLCGGCGKKRAEAKRLYGEAKKRAGDQRPRLPSASMLSSSLRGTVFETLRDQAGVDTELRLPLDLDDIGEASHPRGYIGLIYADGNRMGETIQKLGDLFPGDEAARKAYTTFSSLVDRATREAAVEVLLDMVATSGQGPSDKLRDLPAEIVLAGGDDLILIVPAHLAVPVAARFIEAYQRRTLELQDDAVGHGNLAQPFAEDGLTTSAGVVLAHQSYPALLLVDVAAELMKSAKKAAATTEGKPEGTLDFAVISEAGSESVLDRREHEYLGKLPSGKPFRRTERPYTAAGALELVDQIGALKAARTPRTKLKALYEVLFREPLEAQFEALQLKERLRTTGALEAGPLKDLVDKLNHFPFSDATGDWTTPLSELVELYDYVAAGNSAGGTS